MHLFTHTCKADKSTAHCTLHRDRQYTHTHTHVVPSDSIVNVNRLMAAAESNYWGCY